MNGVMEDNTENKNESPTERIRRIIQTFNLPEVVEGDSKLILFVIDDRQLSELKDSEVKVRIESIAKKEGYKTRKAIAYVSGGFCSDEFLWKFYIRIY